MRRREFLVQSGRAALGASFSSFATPAPSDSWHDNISYLEKQVPQLLAEYHTPGLSIAIIKDAKIVWRRGFGFKDADTRQRSITARFSKLVR
jgi:CubicO group peptidase (beta-lactamase class C family)